MQEEDGFWGLGLCPVQDIDDTVLTNNDPLSLLCCDLYMRRKLKESLKRTMLEQASVFEDQIHELHRLYQRQKELMMDMEVANTCSGNVGVVSSVRTGIDCISSSMDKSVDKVLDLDIEEEQGLKSGEVFESVKHLTDLSKIERRLDLNEPAKIEEHSLIRFSSPVQAKSEREESEAQDPPVSTLSQAENGINLNTSPPLSEEEEDVVTFEKRESDLPGEFLSAPLHGQRVSEPSREIVQALPCLQSVSLFHKRSAWPRRKRGKHGAKSTRSQDLVAEKMSSRSLPMMKSGRNWTNTGKRRLRKPHIESGKVSRTESKTRGSFLDTSLSDSGRNSNEDFLSPLHWFAKIASSVTEDSKSEAGLSLTGFHSDYFEEKTETNRTNDTSVSTIVSSKHKKTRQRQQGEAHHHNEILPSTFVGNKASLSEASETNDAMVIQWGTVRKRSRGIRTPSVNTKPSIAFLRETNHTS